MQYGGDGAWMDILFPGLCRSASEKQLAASGATWNGLSYPITSQPFLLSQAFILIAINAKYLDCNRISNFLIIA